mgnify:CR=1 FL=1
MIKVEIWSDFSCPFCYIGKTRLEKVLSEFKHKDDIQLVYRSYQLNPKAPMVNPLNAYETFAKLKEVTPQEAKAMFQNTVNSAKKIGLNFDYDKMQMTSTYHAHRLAKYARTLKLEKELSNKLFSAYFEEGKNIADKDTLIDISKSLGMDEIKVAEVIDSRLYEKEVSLEVNEATSLGIEGVPFFIFNRDFAVHGAQSEETFKHALNKAYKDRLIPEDMSDEDDVVSCSVDGC